MKMSIRTLAVALVLVGMTAGPASAMLSSQSLSGTVQAALTGSGNVNVVVRDGVATLSGWVDDSYNKQSVIRAALNTDGVESVIDLISQSN